MTIPFSLDELKRHCRVDDDFTDDDALLRSYALAAFAEGSNKTNRDWSEWDETNFPYALRIWVFIRVATFYEKRESLVIGRNGTITNMPRDFCSGLLDAFWLPQNETPASGN